MSSDVVTENENKIASARNTMETVYTSVLDSGTEHDGLASVMEIVMEIVLVEEELERWNGPCQSQFPCEKGGTFLKIDRSKLDFF
jgi:hypothetical protein